MLHFIRNQASSWIVKFILGLIIVVFVFFGWGTYKAKRLNQVGEVNGVRISINEYNKTYTRMVDNLKARFGGNISNQVLEMFQVKKQAVNQLVESILISQKAEKLGLKISDLELADYIAHMKYFLTDNKFDAAKYRGILANNRLSPEEFEYQMRGDLLNSKLMDIISGAVKVSDEEVKKWYKYNNKTVDISYVSFSPDNYKDKNITVKDDEIKNYYDENKASFKSEAVAKAVYLRFAADDFKKNVTVSEDDIKSYYEDNIDDYSTPEKVKAAHILIKVDKNASKKEVEAAKKRLLDVRKKIEKGASFAKMAKKYSEGPSAVSGGDLGEFDRKSMVKPFADAAFSLKKGEMSQPVRTDFGWHLIKVEKKIPASVKELKSVKSEIKNKLADKKAASLAYDRADQVYGATLQGLSLEEESKASGVKLYKTDYFTSAGPGNGVKDPAKFAKQAFSFEKGDTSEIIDAGDVFYLLEVKDKKDAEILPLTEVKDKIKKILISKKKEEKAESDADIYLKAFLKEKSLPEKVKGLNFNIKKIAAFKRQGYIKEMGSAPELQQAVFKTDANGEKYSNSFVKSGKSFYIFYIDKANIPSDEGFEKSKEELAKNILSRKKRYFFKKWMDKYKEGADIKISEKYI